MIIILWIKNNKYKKKFGFKWLSIFRNKNEFMKFLYFKYKQYHISKK